MTILIIGLCATSCLQFQESVFDATGSGVAIPLLFGTAIFTVTGTLRDPDGLKVANADLTIAGSSSTVTTDSNGDFTTSLAAGTHAVTFTFNSKALDITLTVTSAGASTGSSTTGVYYLDANRSTQVSFRAVVAGQDASTCKAWYSDDLTNWTGVIMPTNLSTCMTINDMIYANGVFVAVGATAPSRCYIAYSTDGATWTQATCAPGAGSSSLTSVAYGNGIFMTVGQYDSAVVTIRTSTDNGVTWTSPTTTTGTQDWGAVIYNGQKFYAAMSSVGPQSLVYESADPTATTFTVQGGICSTTAASVMRGEVKGPGFKYIFANNLAGESVILFDGNATCFSAVTFTAQETNIQDIAYDPLENRYAVVGLNCLVDSSTDGTTWAVPLSMNTTACTPTVNFRGVAYSATRKEFIAIGQQTTTNLPFVATSTTAATNTWTANAFTTGGAVNDNPRAIAIRE